MKAIIFNSGLGKRMGEFTQSHHKSMATLGDGRSIFERQLGILSSCGIREIIVTTGPFKEQLTQVAERFPGLTFHFIENPIYNQTNYIYSMYLARNFLSGDMLFLHGDLVFNAGLLQKILKDARPSLCLINPQKQLPEKDFKGRVVDGRLREVSIHIFDKDCFAFQPLYKLSSAVVAAWTDEVVKFVESGETGVYAENALNQILDSVDIEALSYANDYIDEVDNLEDYARVKAEIAHFEEQDHA